MLSDESLQYTHGQCRLPFLPQWRLSSYQWSISGPFLDSMAATAAPSALPLNLSAVSLVPLEGTDFSAVALVVKSRVRGLALPRSTLSLCALQGVRQQKALCSFSCLPSTHKAAFLYARLRRCFPR